MEGHGSSGVDKQVADGTGQQRRGRARTGVAAKARTGGARIAVHGQGPVRLGTAAKARTGPDRTGMARQQWSGMARTDRQRPTAEMTGTERRGSTATAGTGQALLAKARIGFF